MAQLDSKPVTQQEPCNSCSASMEALNILAMSLHTALQAAQYIRVPLPQGLALPFRAVPSDQIPQELRDVCERLGYRLSSTRPVEHAEHMPDNSAPVQHAERMTDSPKPEDQDAGSVTSTSTDWEHEFGIRATPPLESSSPPSSQLTAVESSIPDERWYAVLIGRNPGIYSGSHNVTANVSGVPGGLARRYSTQQLAQAAYEEALDNGQVVRITYEVAKETLSR